MRPSDHMAKPRKPEDKDPVFHATASYKQWVWEELRRREWTLQDLVDEMKRVDRSLTRGRLTAKTKTSGLAGLLGGEFAERRYSTNTELMPAINMALGIAPPSICNPDSPLAQIKDQLDDLWGKADDRQRLELVKALEGVFGVARR